MPYERDPDTPSGPTQPGGGLSNSYYDPRQQQASGTDYGNPGGGGGGGGAASSASSSGAATSSSALPTGIIQAPGTPGLWNTPSSFDYQGVQIGDDGTLWLYTKQYDPAANDGKGGYVWNQTALGKPTDPGYDWSNVETNTGIKASVIRQQYQDALARKQATEAQTRAMGQWHYDSISPYTGAITVKNGANQTATIPLDQVLSPDFATKYPGVDIADIQRNVQTINQQNWLDYGFHAPGTPGYTRATYFSLTPGKGTPSDPSDPRYLNPNPPSRGGGEIPGVTPNPTPGGRTSAVIAGANPDFAPPAAVGARPPGTPAPVTTQPVTGPAPMPTPGASPPVVGTPMPIPVTNPVTAPPVTTEPVPTLPGMRR